MVNFRAPLFIVIGFILGILSFYEFLFNDIWFGLVIFILIIVLGVTLFALKIKAWLGIVAVLAAVILGFLLSNLHYVVLNKNEAVSKDVLLSGRVCDVNRNSSESSVTVYLENCKDDNGVKYRGRVETRVFDVTVHTGEVLTIRGTLNSVYPIKGDIQAYYLRSNIRYELQTELLVSQSGGKMKLDETIRKYVYDVSAKYAPQNGDVLYALLTGDRSAMSNEKEAVFKLSGIIHLLAVSGLHVGFVVVILSFILKRFKLHPLIECAVLLVPLIFYAYVCSFTPSIVRAIVMLVCGYLARAVYGRYDLLTSLSFAVIVLLLISPFNLFDLGFQLSALSVYGIATVYGSLNRALSKRKIPKALRYVINSLAISLSCSLATFFTLQLNYGYASVIGILFNMVAIPVVSVVFVLGWIGMLPWVFHYVLWLADWILQFIVVSARWLASLPFATVSVKAANVTAVVVALWMFVLGGYVNLKKVGKIVTNIVLAVAVCLCVGLSYVKAKPVNQAYVTFGYNDTMCVATSAGGEAAIVGNFSEAYVCSNALNYVGKYKVTSCVLYVTDYGEANPDLLEEMLRSFNVLAVYKLDFSYNAAADEVFNNHNVAVYQQMENSTIGNAVTVTSIYDGGLRAVVVNSGELTATAVYGSDYAVANYLSIGLPSSVYVLPNANKDYSDRGLVTLSFNQSLLPYNYGANKYGNFTITQKGDTISIKFR